VIIHVKCLLLICCGTLSLYGDQLMCGSVLLIVSSLEQVRNHTFDKTAQYPRNCNDHPRVWRRRGVHHLAHVEPFVEEPINTLCIAVVHRSSSRMAPDSVPIQTRNPLITKFMNDSW
jgi:hypothetical protein